MSESETQRTNPINVIQPRVQPPNVAWCNWEPWPPFAADALWPSAAAVLTVGGPSPWPLLETTLNQPMRRSLTCRPPIIDAVIQVECGACAEARSATRVEEAQWQEYSSCRRRLAVRTQPGKIQLHPGRKCRGCSVWTRGSPKCLLVSPHSLHLRRRRRQPEDPVAVEINPRTNGATSIPPGWSGLLRRPRSWTCPVSVPEGPVSSAATTPCYTRLYSAVL